MQQIPFTAFRLFLRAHYSKSRNTVNAAFTAIYNHSYSGDALVPPQMGDVILIPVKPDSPVRWHSRNSGNW